MLNLVTGVHHTDRRRDPLLPYLALSSRLSKKKLGCTESDMESRDRSRAQSCIRIESAGRESENGSGKTPR